MDAVAADVSMQYIKDCDNRNNAYFVTAAVDGITFLRNPSACHDMKI